MSKKKIITLFKNTSQKRLQGPSMIIMLNTKVKAINNYQSGNTLKTLDHIYVI